MPVCMPVHDSQQSNRVVCRQVRAINDYIDAEIETILMIVKLTTYPTPY